MEKGDLDVDARGLIFEAYRMDVGPAECRSIFLDWALGAPSAGPEAVALLLDRYGEEHPDHPMTAVLREAERAPRPPRRRRRRTGPGCG